MGKSGQKVFPVRKCTCSVLKKSLRGIKETPMNLFIVKYYNLVWSTAWEKHFDYICCHTC